MNKTLTAALNKWRSTVAWITIYAVLITPYAWFEARRDIVKWSLQQPEADAMCVSIQQEQFAKLPLEGKHK